MAQQYKLYNMTQMREQQEAIKKVPGEKLKLLEAISHLSHHLQLHQCHLNSNLHRHLQLQKK